MSSVISTIQPGSYPQAVEQFFSHLNPQQPELPADFTGSLRELTRIARQFSTIPYENISKILKFYSSGGQIFFRSPDEVLQDHMQRHLGGTCFSLTFFLLEILRSRGYTCHPVLGDMKWGENVHCAVLLHHEATDYLVDPGYMIHEPLQISRDRIKRHLTPHSGIEIRYRTEDERFDLYTFRSGNFTWRYRFTAAPVSMEEFTRHWSDSFFKPTMNGICLTRIQDQEMVYVHNDFTKISGHTEVRRIRDRNQTEHIIQDIFRISMELVEEARYLLKTQRKLSGSEY